MKKDIQEFIYTALGAFAIVAFGVAMVISFYLIGQEDEMRGYKIFDEDWQGYGT